MQNKKRKKIEESCVNEISDKRRCSLSKFPPDRSVLPCSCATANFHGVLETECLIYFHQQILFIVLYIIICKEGFYLAV